MKRHRNKKINCENYLPLFLLEKDRMQTAGTLTTFRTPSRSVNPEQQKRPDLSLTFN